MYWLCRPPIQRAVVQSQCAMQYSLTLWPGCRYVDETDPYGTPVHAFAKWLPEDHEDFDREASDSDAAAACHPYDYAAEFWRTPSTPTAPLPAVAFANPTPKPSSLAQRFFLMRQAQTARARLQLAQRRAPAAVSRTSNSVKPSRPGVQADCAQQRKRARVQGADATQSRRAASERCSTC